MQKKHLSALKKFYWVLAFVLILLITTVVWLYSGTLSEAKLKIFKTVPLPMALVNGRPISAGKFLARFAVAQKTLGQNGAEGTKLAIASELIREAEVSRLASQRDVAVSAKQIDLEYAAVSGQTDLGGGPNFEEFLQSRGLSESSFKNDVLKPKLLLNGLRIWFNLQPNLNSAAYQKANSLLEQINSGGNMPALAARFSEDAAGKSADGDMGFVQITDLSPELRESVSNMKPGEVKIIPGLLGINIIRLEGQTGNLLHLRQIFLNTNDFNAWLDSQAKNFKIINLLKI